MILYHHTVPLTALDELKENTMKKAAEMSGQKKDGLSVNKVVCRDKFYLSSHQMRSCSIFQGQMEWIHTSGKFSISKKKKLYVAFPHPRQITLSW